MKFLSNFDTGLLEELITKYQHIHSVEHVLVIRRSKLFFWFNIIVPLSLLIVTLILISIGIWRDFGDETLYTVKAIGGSILAIGLMIKMGVALLKKYIDYKMDFTIITPKEVIFYNQSGLTNRTTRIIDTDKIKTVSKSQSGFIKSFFNYGELVFLSEWDTGEHWEIQLSRVHSPEYIQTQARNIIEWHLLAARQTPPSSSWPSA